MGSCGVIEIFLKSGSLNKIVDELSNRKDLTASQKWALRHPDYSKTPERRIKQREAYRRYVDKNPTRRMLSSAKTRAKRDGLTFEIELADLTIPETCPILLIPLSLNKGKAGDSSPTLDRIDNSQGYIKNNIRVISRKANTYKTDMTPEIIERLYRYVTKDL